MKKPIWPDDSSDSAVSRRDFLTRSATAAIGFTIVPRRVLGVLDSFHPATR